MNNNLYHIRWKLHRPPIRPTSFFLEVIESVMNCIEKPSSMILGSTPEFVDLLISRNCLNIASIDNNKENHLSMLKLCNAQNKDKLSFVNSNWLNQGDEGKLSYDIIVGDISHYFLSFPD